MSEPRLISPLLDDFIMGEPISNHHGVRCCPAIKNESDERYIVKIISIPATPTQLDALLLSGAYADKEAAINYFKEVADGVIDEVSTLGTMADLEGFVSYTDYQVVPMEAGDGFDIYLLGTYKRTLQKHFTNHAFTHLDALNLGLDLCAALSVCRRNGYLYIDLKPSNVYVSDQRQFRIGDLGFVRLDSLKYASIPDKYFSEYTAPEVSDAFSALNATMDIYAAGLILYQAYNNGELPFNDEILPGDTLPAPLYADYEMSEIILKACAPYPEDRWQDPMQMGQAIVSYMQRNGAQDTPIVPMPEEEPSLSYDEDSQFEQSEPDASDLVEYTTESAYTEDEQAEDAHTPVDLSFEESFEDPEEDIPTDYEAITEEVTEMLEQADELAALTVPESVVVPDHVDIPMPEITEEPDGAEDIDDDIEIEEDDLVIITTEETDVTSEDTESEDTDEAEAEEATEEGSEPDHTEEWSVNEDDYSTEFITANVKSKRNWLRYGILILLVLVLLTAGFFFYKNYYLLPIEFITVEGNEDTLAVYVTTDIDDSLLQVVCSDTYGNKIIAPVIDGKAEFTDLIPNTAYTIKVVANGFHRLTGSASTAYSTPIQTNIVQFDAVSGATEDSAILNFTVEGPDCNEWTVLYSAEGEEERSATFSAHTVTLTNLTVGKEYTFRLVSDDGLYIAGSDELKFTPRKLIKAENVEIISCMNNTLTVKWDVPVGENVASWSVRCSNDTYSQTIITTTPTATFRDLDHNAAFLVEVKAVGMSVSQTATISSNSVTAADFQTDTTDPSKLVFTWTSSQPVPNTGWVFRYRIAGIDSDVTIPCSTNSAVISPVIPNATYYIQIEDTNGNILLGSKNEIVTGSPAEFRKDFSNFSAVNTDLEFTICRTPKREGWGRYDLKADDYTDKFTAGESMSFLVKFQKLYNAPKENVSIFYVVRNLDGTPILCAEEHSTWAEMWPLTYCKLTVPMMPAAAGAYTIEVYFNNGLAHTQEFTVS